VLLLLLLWTTGSRLLPLLWTTGSRVLLLLWTTGSRVLLAGAAVRGWAAGCLWVVLQGSVWEVHGDRGGGRGDVCCRGSLSAEECLKSGGCTAAGMCLGVCLEVEGVGVLISPMHGCLQGRLWATAAAEKLARVRMTLVEDTASVAQSV